MSLASIADWHHVAWALRRACRGKQKQAVIQRLLRQPETAIVTIAEALRQGELPLGQFSAFQIHDPKIRLIHAAPIEDRIAHHALIAYMEPTFERLLLPSVYACRVGKGVHAAIAYAQNQMRRFNWVMHLDIDQYFPSIDQQVLREQLHRRFKGDGLKLVHSVIDAYENSPARGLPIGALTSQHLANHYLNGADRWCLQQAEITAHCRYMDDFLLWSDSQQKLQQVADRFQCMLSTSLKLNLKKPRIQSTRHGILFCGIHISPFHLAASQRRRHRYRHALQALQQATALSELEKQQRYAAIRTILLPANELAWRQRCLSACEHPHV